jgi:uncharacterized protein YecE (DUF72 family)
MDTFIKQLPRSAKEAESVARRHDHRLKRGALVETTVDVPYRHAFEVRHASYFNDAFYDLLQRHGCGFVIADSAGRFPYDEQVTADFVYVRLHGSTELYVSGYTDHELDAWARKVVGWLEGPPGKDVYVYFDNDVKVRAPFDAIGLHVRVESLLANGSL